jgi:hypothetical protein
VPPSREGAPPGPPHHSGRGVGLPTEEGFLRKRLILVTLGVALAIPALASAHGVWYFTSSGAETSIIEKYPAVLDASCKPLPVWARAQYGARSILSDGGTTRRWNHFYCGVWSRVLDAPCLVVFHGLGQRNIVVTSWPRGGCTTRALWG